MEEDQNPVQAQIGQMNSGDADTNMGTVDHYQIYQKQAQQYDLLVRREDYQHNLEKALWDIIPPESTAAVELGAGTGRITCMLAQKFKNIYAFDRSRHMLETARKNLQAFEGLRWNLAVCDHPDLPVKDGLADLVISGWSICYALVGEPQEWKGTLNKVLGGMFRVLHPDGVLVLIETMGTGFEKPQPPEGLVPYFRVLEARGFRHTWVRTDYQFLGMDEAEELTRFFFGEEMLAKLVPADGRITLPECTGIWWVKKQKLGQVVTGYDLD